jgi:fructose-bisphosphate aldolase/2-amino-3,7-dideoxy-D-threo-hept-6-ulosonate synthase
MVTEMSVGKRRRLRRIFREDGKTVIVPMDHGVTLGPVKGLENMQEAVNKLALGGTDAVVVHKGIAKSVDTRAMGLIIHLSASTNLGSNPLWKVQVCSVAEAVRLGADGISIHVNVGAPEEGEMLAEMGLIAEECEELGIPLLAMMYPRGPSIKDSNDVEVVKHVSRLGAELGADVVKTNYTGSPETFREVIRGCPVPVVIAGGPKQKTVEGILRMVYDSVQAGGVGVSIGRNTFQHENPTLMAKALSAIVHKGANVEEGLKIVEGAG